MHYFLLTDNVGRLKAATVVIFYEGGLCPAGGRLLADNDNDISWVSLIAVCLKEVLK